MHNETRSDSGSAAAAAEPEASKKLDGPRELGRIRNRHERRALARQTRHAMPAAFRAEVSTSTLATHFRHEQEKRALHAVGVKL